MSMTPTIVSDAKEDIRKRSATDARQDGCSKRWSETNGKARTRMKLIDADLMVTVMLYDEERENYYTERMTIAECLDRYTEEGCPWKGADDETDNI